MNHPQISPNVRMMNFNTSEHSYIGSETYDNGMQLHHNGNFFNSKRKCQQFNKNLNYVVTPNAVQRQLVSNLGPLSITSNENTIPMEIENHILGKRNYFSDINRVATESEKPEKSGNSFSVRDNQKKYYFSEHYYFLFFCIFF